MGDRLTQGSLARGMSKLRRAPRSARPRGPSALPSDHEIVSDGCEVCLHAYKFLGPVAETSSAKNQQVGLPALRLTKPAARRFVASSVDGGSNNPLQKAAVPLLEPGFVDSCVEINQCVGTIVCEKRREVDFYTGGEGRARAAGSF